MPLDCCGAGVGGGARIGAVEISLIGAGGVGVGVLAAGVAAVWIGVTLMLRASLAAVSAVGVDTAAGGGLGRPIVIASRPGMATRCDLPAGVDFFHTMSSPMIVAVRCFGVCAAGGIAAVGAPAAAVALELMTLPLAPLAEERMEV